MQAKLAYLAATPNIRGIHEKALLDATLFGLPMLGVNMPGSRDTAASGSSLVSSTDSTSLGVPFADLSLGGFGTTAHTTTGLNPNATYYSGRDGVASNPGEPALPRYVANVGVTGEVLRGVGFRSGVFDQSSVVPLAGAPGTESGGAQTPFESTTFFPARPWLTSYFGDFTGGSTNLVVTPAQHRVVNPGDATAQLRLYSTLGLRLFYAGASDAAAAQSGAPSIFDVQATLAGNVVSFAAHVRGSDATGADNVKTAWVTYTFGTTGCHCWQSLDLARDAGDTNLWTGSLTLPGGVSANDLQFILQSANSAALVAVNDKGGAYFSLADTTSSPASPTTLKLTAASSSGPYGGNVGVSATLASGASALAGKSVVFRVGSSIATAVTDSSGVANASLPLLTPPATDQLAASFAGDAGYQGSAATSTFTVDKVPTTIAVHAPASIVFGGASGISATLSSGGSPLGFHTITFVIVGTDANTSGSGYSKSVSTDASGAGALGTIPILPGRGVQGLRVLQRHDPAQPLGYREPVADHPDRPYLRSGSRGLCLTDREGAPDGAVDLRADLGDLRGARRRRSRRPAAPAAGR